MITNTGKIHSAYGEGIYLGYVAVEWVDVTSGVEVKGNDVSFTGGRRESRRFTVGGQQRRRGQQYRRRTGQLGDRRRHIVLRRSGQQRLRPKANTRSPPFGSNVAGKETAAPDSRSEVPAFDDEQASFATIGQQPDPVAALKNGLQSGAAGQDNVERAAPATNQSGSVAQQSELETPGPAVPSAMGALRVAPGRDPGWSWPVSA